MIQINSFSDMLASGPVLTEGSVIERIRHHPGVTLDPDVLNAGLIYDPAGRRLMADIYREYVSVAQTLGRPMLLFAPTWRASAERLQRAGLSDMDGVSRDAVDFVRSLIRASAPCPAPLAVGALMACKHDAYDPAAALDEQAAADYHRFQVDALDAAGPDVIKAATLPAVGEALGMARALSRAGRPYLMGFVVHPDGRLLDGTSLDAAVEAIDRAVDPKPTGYMIDCTHPRTIAAAIDALGDNWERIAFRMIGFQANGSDLPPETLDRIDHLESDAPEALARDVAALMKRHPFTLIGGCCGTDHRHIKAMAKAVQEITTGIKEGP